MKTKLILLFVLISTFGYAQNVNIPDANFKTYLVGNTEINTNGDTEIQVSEASTYTGNIGVQNLNISDLTGIEAFTNLTELFCTGNTITSIDVSNNTALEVLYCDNNALTSLNVSANTALEHLECKDNSITSLDISKNTTLRFLNCRNNNLTSLDSSNNTALTDLDCSNNAITSLNVSNNPTLVYFRCHNNALTSLDVTNSPDLILLYCMDNALTSLNVTANTVLEQLRCDGNSITGLDFSNNTALQELYCEDNALTLLNLDNRGITLVTQFDARNNNLTCIQVHNASAYNASSLMTSRIDATASFSDNCNSVAVTYVNHSAIGNNDGTSWADAHTSLQDALNNTPTGNYIWVAKGTYKPHASDVDASFIVNNTIYGGFTGTETDVSDRDLSLIHTANATILSGDLLSDDDATVDFNDTTRDDNSKHVVEVARTDLEINGFTIKDGNANGSGNDRFGGGIYKEKVVNNLTVKNCVIKNNVASYSGAGLAITNLDSSIIIIDACIIENNLAPAGAGLDYHMSTLGKSMSITITNSLFNANKTDDNTVTLKGTGASAARFRAYYSGVTLSTTLVNNTFVNNSSKGDTSNSSAGNFPVIDLSYNDGNLGTLIISNNIFWNNVTNGNSVASTIGSTNKDAIYYVSVSSPSFTNNTDESNQLSSSNTNPNLDANFKLTAASTTEINGGANNQIPTGITTDLAGNQRIFNTTVDRGAYEFGSVPLGVDKFSFLENQVTIYPNPTTSFLKIKTDSNLKCATIYSVLGAKVLETSSKNITTSNLKRGLYLIKIETENGSVSTKRFMKE